MAKNRFLFLEILSVVGVLFGSALIFSSCATNKISEQKVAERGPASETATGGTTEVTSQADICVDYRIRSNGQCTTRNAPQTFVACPSQCYFPGLPWTTRYGLTRQLTSEPTGQGAPLDPQLHQRRAEPLPPPPPPRPNTACTVTTITRQTRLCGIVQGNCGRRCRGYRRRISNQCNSRSRTSVPATVEANTATMGLCASGVRTAIENLMGEGPPTAACANVLDEALTNWTMNLGGRQVQVMRRLPINSSADAPPGAICVMNTNPAYCSHAEWFGHAEIVGMDGRLYSDFNQSRTMQGREKRVSAPTDFSLRRVSESTEHCRYGQPPPFRGATTGHMFCDDAPIRGSWRRTNLPYAFAGCFVFTDEAEDFIEQRRITGVYSRIASEDEFANCRRTQFDQDTSSGLEDDNEEDEEGEDET